MIIVRFTTPSKPAPAVGVLDEDGLRRIDVDSIAELLAMSISTARPVVESSFDQIEEPYTLLAPIDHATELWASGVTYLRSREARKEESGIPSVYSLVYDADRPELFFKSVSWRVVSTNHPIGIREDSELNVPEPELAVVVNSAGKIFGYSICNDVSSRTLEGENPLYLPQAKIFAGSASLGPGILPAWEVKNVRDVQIEISVLRDGAEAWAGSTSIASMRRSLDELVEYAARADYFPHGLVLSTGTGLVPSMDFSLASGDRVRISVPEIGVLENEVTVGRGAFKDLFGTGAFGARETAA